MKQKNDTYNIKNLGQVSTPNIIVEFMLDCVGYNKEIILKKHIIDNSCGERSFLKKYSQKIYKNSKTKKFSPRKDKRRFRNLYSWYWNRLCRL